MSVTKVQWAGQTAEAAFELDYDLCICEHVNRVSLPPFYALNDDDVAWQITVMREIFKPSVNGGENCAGRWLHFHLYFKSSSGKEEVPVRWDVKITQSVSGDAITTLCERNVPHLTEHSFSLNRLKCLKNMDAIGVKIGSVCVVEALDNKVLIHVKLLFVNEGNLSVVNAPKQPLGQSFKKSEEKSLRALGSSLDGLLQSGLMSDVTLSVDGHELRAHRTILAARSDVFKAMFASDCRESASGIVKIEDIRLPVFKEFLRFIYRASLAPSAKPPASKAAALVAVEEDGANAGARDQQQAVDEDEDDCLMELLVAADKYLVEDLKEVCQGRLLDRLSADVDGASVKTLCDALRAGHHLASAPLREVGIGYLRTHRAAVVATPEWKDFATVNRTVAAEAMLDSMMPPPADVA